MANRLENETSPYLLQHANNPVDWYPWGAEALTRAREEDKPILLSIGYAACHWCHVMEHESFEDAPTALLMNDRFVCIKVDREERPDLDAIYMQAVQAMTGHGGWPMTVILTPEGVPFFGGTYFPKEERHGMPSFVRVLNSVSNAYKNRREDVERTVGSVREMYASVMVRPAKSGTVTPELFERVASALRAEFDAKNGGFGGAPKFPPTMVLEWLLSRAVRAGDESAEQMVLATFRAMARGGIHDQLGGGFSRYAVDALWLVPHFEKMLYDNALLIRFGTHLWQRTRDAEVRRVTEEAIQWVSAEMTAPAGGFYASYDADSEGHEGKFYVWSADELREVAGDDAALAAEYWGVTPEGNFEGANILSVVDDPRTIAAAHGIRIEELEQRIAAVRQRLYAHRARRVWPARDEKILAGWNGLMIRALAEGAAAFDRADLREAAIRAGTFAFATFVRGGRVQRTATAGSRRVAGVLEDYAALGLAALALYEVTLADVWLTRARALGDSIRDLFWDNDLEAFYDTANDHEALIVRPRDVSDNAIPSGTSLACELLVRLGTIHGDADALRMVNRVLETVAEPMARYPLAFGHMLAVADMVVHGTIDVAITGDRTSLETRALVTAALADYVPARVLAVGEERGTMDLALLRDRVPVEGRATAYVCRGFSCDLPTSDPKTLREQLAAAASQNGR